MFTSLLGGSLIEFDLLFKLSVGLLAYCGASYARTFRIGERKGKKGMAFIWKGINNP